MHFRLMMAAVAAVSLIAAPAAAQGPPDNAGPPTGLPEQAEQGAGNAERADAGRVDDQHRATQSDVRDDRAGSGAANAEQGDQQADAHGADGRATAQDARDGGRDFGLDKAEENVNEHAPDEAEAGEALEDARAQGPDEDAGADANGDQGWDEAGEASGIFASVTEVLGNAVDSAWGAVEGVLSQLGGLFGAGDSEE